MKRIFLLFAFLLAALGVSAQSKVAVNGTIVCTENGIKDCSKCLKPHRRENYGAICEKMSGIFELAKKKP